MTETNEKKISSPSKASDRRGEPRWPITSPENRHFYHGRIQARKNRDIIVVVGSLITLLVALVTALVMLL